jgi:hypothetical protein
MCEHGTTVDVLVPIPADLAWEGELTWKIKPVDACIAPIVKALNEGGVLTRSCCCGHGARRPEIILADHSRLVLLAARDAPPPVEGGQ